MVTNLDNEINLRYKDDIRKSLRNGDCFVKIPRPTEGKKSLWTINSKYVIGDQMHLECEQVRTRD